MKQLRVRNAPQHPRPREEAVRNRRRAAAKWGPLDEVSLLAAKRELTDFKDAAATTGGAWHLI
ncbi:Neuroguidin [Manis pentadactyla]|nr:Neuroguidin [Manis pentadactyla]